MSLEQISGAILAAATLVQAFSVGANGVAPAGSDESYYGWCYDVFFVIVCFCVAGIMLMGWH